MGLGHDLVGQAQGQEVLVGELGEGGKGEGWVALGGFYCDRFG